MNTFRLFWVLPVTLAGVGCQGPAGGPVGETAQTVFVLEGQEAVLWESAQEVLRDQRFRLDRIDRRAGLITTHPVGTQHFFEFWRHDVATPWDAWEATVCPLRRRAMVHIDLPGPDGQGRIEVTVRKERRSSPERQFNNSAAAIHFFRDSIPSAQTGRPISGEDEEWVDLGRDPALEATILAMIVARSGVRSPADGEPIEAAGDETAPSSDPPATKHH